MNNYPAIMLRLRFLKGFSEDGLHGIHELLFERMGKEGIADKPFPIPSSLLMSPDILTSMGFSTSAEKGKVPAWRDGALGLAIQRRMPEVAARRYFDHGCVRSAKPLFASAAAWPAFTRLIDHIHQLFVHEFGAPGTWSDSVNIRYREIWRGDMDHEMVQFSVAAGAHLDNNPHQMQARLKSELPCVTRLLRSIDEARKLSKATVQAPLADAVPEADAADSDPLVASASCAADGVINSAVDGFSEMSAAERKQLAAELTKKAADERAKLMDRELSYQAAAILRSRVLITKRAEQARPGGVVGGRAQGQRVRWGQYGGAHSPRSPSTTGENAQPQGEDLLGV